MTYDQLFYLKIKNFFLTEISFTRIYEGALAPTSCIDRILTAYSLIALYPIVS